MKDTILSLSGGLDSSSLLFEYKDRIKLCVSFKYPSNHNAMELKAARRVAKKAGIPHKIIDVTKVFKNFKSALLSGADAVPNAEYNAETIAQLVVPFRNGIFLSILAGLAESIDCEYIALANHSGDHCFTADTEFLTPDGIKNLNKINVGDKIYSFNTDSLKIEEDEITNIIKVGKNDLIYNIKTFAGEIKLTSEHKVYVLRLGDFQPQHGYEKFIEKIKVSELTENDYMIQPTNLIKQSTDQSQNFIDTFSLAERIRNKHNASFSIFEENDKVWINRKHLKYLSMDRFINTRDFVLLLTWYITEGHSSKQGFSGGNKNGNKFCAQFSQSIAANLEKVELIENIIKDNGFHIRREYGKELFGGYPRECTFYCSNILSIFMKDCGAHAEDKHIPDWLMEILLADYDIRMEFLNHLILGDGSIDSFGVQYSSISEELIKQIIFLYTISGYHYSLQKERGSGTYVRFYKKGRKSAAISLGDAKFTKISKIDKIKKEEDVYDITVKNNHNFFAGSKGFHLISNSVYPDCRPEFTDAMNAAVTAGTSNNVKFFSPYVNISKAEIAARGMKAGLNPDWTYSCYKGGEKPCNQCPTCVERNDAIIKALNSLKD